MSQKQKITIFIIIISLVLLSIASFSFDYKDREDTYPEIKKESDLKIEIPQQPKTDQISYEKGYLDIEGVVHEGKLINGESVYSFMNRLKDEKKITFTEKTYSGMGQFIDEINGIKGNGEKHWIYYVNGEKAKIGVTVNKLKSGDVVSWKYENDLNNQNEK